jgi:inosine/xanthosine triphosphate pyrophosphatase family protein
MNQEDAELRAALSMLDPDALAALQRMALADDSTAFYRALARQPDVAAMTQRIAGATSDDVARLRVLRAIRDLGTKKRLG